MWFSAAAMIPTYSLRTVLAPLVLLRWLGLSPYIERLTLRTIPSVLMSALLVAVLAFCFLDGAFYLQELFAAVGLIYSMIRNVIDRNGFIELLAFYRDLDRISGQTRYSVRWSFFLNLFQTVLKMSVAYIEGLVVADILLVIVSLKQEEINIMVHVLRCQSEVLKSGGLHEYRLVNRALASLRNYLKAELPVSCFLCFLWCSNTSFLGVSSLVRILLSSGDNGQTPTVFYCLCYWTSFFVSILSIATAIADFNVVEDKKEEYEERLYWSMVSADPRGGSVTAKHLILLEVGSRDQGEEELRIDNTLLYSVISSTVTFLVLLLQFGLEDIICIKN